MILYDLFLYNIWPVYNYNYNIDIFMWFSFLFIMQTLLVPKQLPSFEFIGLYITKSFGSFITDIDIKYVNICA